MKAGKGRIIFQCFNYTLLAAAGLLCLLPLVNILAMSFSSASAVAGGNVFLWPVDFNFHAYEYVMGKREFWLSVLRTLERVGIGLPLTMFVTIMTAYPLSKTRSQLRFRTGYAWIFFFTMLFSGGLIPGYLLIHNLKMMDTIWALVLPTAVPVYNIVLMLNFFRTIPDGLEEAALIDGAGHLRICWQIFVPCALPSIATISLFTFIGHWNSYFDGLIFSNFPDSYPLASYLYTVVVKRDMSQMSIEQYKAMSMIDDRTIRCAQIFISMVPVMMIYPFAQKYFVTGMTLGAVKG